MAFERVALFGLIDVDLECTGMGVIRLSTDLPATSTPAQGSLPAGWAVRETKPIPTTGRRVLRFRLQGTTKGRQYILTITPTGSAIIRLYGAKIWARVLPSPGWEWHTVPVPATSESWEPVKLNIPPTGPEWMPVKLIIPETPADFQAVKLSIPETGDWAPVKLPIKPTPATPEWVDIQVDE